LESHPWKRRGIWVKKKVTIDWKIPKSNFNANNSITKYRLYLESLGLKENTVNLYTQLVKSYLE
jgi:hypothetical protein